MVKFMDRLWAPWRIAYINKIGKQKGCIFCRILKEQKDTVNHIFLRKKHTFAVLNIYPYNNGHVLILPNRHVGDLENLERIERDELLDLLVEVKNMSQAILDPGGFNVGFNLGRLAGAGFPGHLHIHIVPRWKGDSNFMPVIGGARVMSQSLNELYKRFKKCAQEKKSKN